MIGRKPKPGRPGTIRLLAAVIVIGGVGAGIFAGRAQTSPSPPLAGSTSALAGSTSASAPPEGVIGLARLFDEADADVRLIEGRLLSAREPLPELPGPAEIEERISVSRDKVLRQAGLNILTLSDLDQEIQLWTRQAKQVDDTSTRLGDRIQDLQRMNNDLADLQARWRKTNEAYQGAELGAASQQRINQVIEAATQGNAAIEAAIPPLLDGQSKLSGTRTLIREHLDFLAQRRQWLTRSTWDQDSPSFFETGLDGLFARERFTETGLAERWNGQLEEARQHLGRNRARVIALLMAVLLVWFWMRSVLPRLGKVTGEVPDVAELNTLFRHPLAVSLLLCCLAAPLLISGPPLLVRELYLIALLAPVLFLLIRLTAERHLQYFIVGMGVCYVLGVTRDLLLGTPPLDRLLLIFQAGLGLTVTMVTLSPARLHEQAGHRGWKYLPDGVRFARWTLAVLLGAALIGQLTGYTRASQLFGKGAFGAVNYGLLALVTYRLLRSLAVFFIYGPAVKRLRGFSDHAARLTRSVSRALFSLAVLLWLYWVAVILNVDDPVREALAEIWDLGFMIGQNKITVAVMAGAGLAIYLSIRASRVLTFILEAEVYPRRMTPPGLGHALNQGIGYVFVFIGIVLALSILGVRLQSLAIVAGALGIGIGFGLQNVVNNFVAGIIMLMERPVRLGDVIEVEGLWGIVRHIGIRATVIETWDQSEIIVPNGDLLWSKLVNWTRTNGANRITVEVGVAYGSDPEQVIRLLQEIAADHPEVLTNPAPAVLFTGFGDSSLDFALRCYLPAIEGRLRVPSELRVAIYQALDEAGIEIPFPQRDLHIKSAPAPHGPPGKASREPDSTGRKEGP